MDFVEGNLPRIYTFPHRDYNPINFRNDIGLIYLKSGDPCILKKPNVALVELPNKNDARTLGDLVKMRGILSGFGVDNNRGNFSIKPSKSFN